MPKKSTMSTPSKRKSPSKTAKSPRKKMKVSEMSLAQYRKSKGRDASPATIAKKCREEGKSMKKGRCVKKMKKSPKKKSPKKRSDYAGVSSAVVDNAGIAEVVAPSTVVSLINNDFTGVTVDYLKKLASCDSAGGEDRIRGFLGTLQTSDLVGIRDALIAESK
jgi:hypothetical protein